MLCCPDCGHEQTEPAIALSSACRECGAYFKIRDGCAVSNTPRPVHPFASGTKTPPPPSSPEPSPPPATPPAAEDKPGRPTTPARGSADGATRFKPRHKTSPPNKVPQREIDCLECDHSHSIPAASTSTLCPHCGSYISLQNYEINEDWTSRIETRGDVVVGRKGRIHGVTLRCYDLTLKGTLEGRVDCSGEFRVGGEANIIGELRCRRLNVEKRGRLHLDHPGWAGEMEVDGVVEGDLTCEGRVVLRKHARVHGTLTAGALVVRPGARHDGQVQITGPSLTTQVSEALEGDD